MYDFDMFFNYETFEVAFCYDEWEQEWHITAIPDEIWNGVPQEVLADLLFFQMDYHIHLERLEEERLEAIRQQERIIRLAVLFVESRRQQ